MKSTKSERRQLRSKQRERRWWKRFDAMSPEFVRVEGPLIICCDRADDALEAASQRARILARRVAYGGRKGRRAKRRLFEYAANCLWMP